MPLSADLIEATLLRVDASEETLVSLCELAVSQGCRAVCILPSQLALVRERLRGSAVRTVSVGAFPYGASLLAAKLAELLATFEAGADEVDLVLDWGAHQRGGVEALRREVYALAEGLREHWQQSVKVIVESGMLPAPVLGACLEALSETEVFCVKTSTGCAAQGATVAAVQQMRAALGPLRPIKAAGGIRTPEAAQAMLDAGATWLGASRPADLLAS